MIATVLTRVEEDVERIQIQKGSVEGILVKTMSNKVCVKNSGDLVIRTSRKNGLWQR
jgi:hypothetical protein